jgi:ribosomal protein L37AE/L43A
MRGALSTALGGALAVLLAASAADAGSVDGPPHKMTLPDGQLDPAICPVCHTPDMSLQRTELETCTLCHAETTHGGSLEHVQASPAAVEQTMATRPKDALALPLTKEGKIYCGTCHLFHDPAVLQEKWLAQGWVPPATGFAAGVRAGVEKRWTTLEEAFDKGPDAGTFVTEGTRLLRAPVADGTLCRQCHGSLW